MAEIKTVSLYRDPIRFARGFTLCNDSAKSQASRFFAMDDADLLEVAAQRLDIAAQLPFIACPE